ncbi:hypothetical protein [Kitasatospora phosalacinea]|uniref:Uncharacterized protein n=1 Tax=Kitasatospora phosalacinea TaxID=2065 RepID=A0A9W6PL66_9ACTN|nr:hypothetical protein [Kitasatospora phosalacinea]GLW56812.1 hypothetical protein Kpho01_48230 [Kitasatospora phosalacinea]
MADEDDGLDQVRLSALVSRKPTQSLPPPLAADILPCGKLSPPLFERLVGETMWIVDGMNDIRGYGRSGQNQGGLDLIGRKGGSTHVYQVRRIVSLSPAALREAVTDFAGPPRTTTPEPQWTRRRFQAVRFVLAVGCQVDDTAVEDELVALQEKYHDDLQIDLYDAAALTRFLRDRPTVVGAVFGSQWAKALYGLELPPVPALPNAYALLNDPLEYLELAPALARAEETAASDPLKAAILMADLADILTQANYRAHAATIHARRRELLHAGGRPHEALLVSAAILMDHHDNGFTAGQELAEAKRLAADCQGAERHLYTVLQALNDWYVHGYDLGPVVTALTELADAGIRPAGRLALAVAEQVVVEDDPLDDPEDLQALSERIADDQPAEIRVRMQCCLADLAIRAHTPPARAYADLASRALSGRIPERLASLVLMRQGRALAMADEGAEAVEAYRRAVLAAMSAGLAADARHALRTIAMLSHQFSYGRDGFAQSAAALLGARTIGSREAGLIQGAYDPAIGALEELVDDRPREAVRDARRWLWQERLGGALADEQIARKRLGEAWERADMPQQAVRQFILAGERKKAVAVAAKTDQFLDTGCFLEIGARWVREAAAAVLEAQADLVPDRDVEQIADDLAGIVVDGPPAGMSSSDPVRHATGALAALGHRLPQAALTRVWPTVLTWLPRQPHHYRFTDDPMLALFSACTQADLTEAGQAVDALWDALKSGIPHASAHLTAVTTHHDRIKQELLQRAGTGDLDTAAILASWRIDDAAVENTARKLTAKLLAEPVLTPGVIQGMSTWPVLCAALLTVVPTGSSTAGTEDDDPIEQLRDKAAHHLLSWAQDTRDTADRRTTVLRALARLAPALPSETRTAMVAPLIALHTNPGSHPMDEFEQRSHHPLSAFTVTTDAQNLPAAALHAAAACATTPEQAAAINRLTLTYITAHPGPPSTASLCAQALDATDLLDPVPIHLIAAHPAAHMRQCAVVCWARRPHEEPHWVQAFANDTNTTVRANLAHTLSRMPAGQQQPHAPILDQLRNDRSARVRQAVTGRLPDRS